MDEKKIIPFPIDKVRKPGRPDSQNETNARGVSSRRRMVLSLSVASVLVLATVWFEKLNRPQMDGRTPAQFSGSTRNLDEEINLARKISRDSVREPASQGRKPNAEDKLRLETLAGLYAVRSVEGALDEIEFMENSGPEPIYLYSRDKFLFDHQDLLRIPFHTVQHVETVRDKEGSTEVYALIGDGENGPETLATVRFHFDKPQRFHSMKVESRNRQLSSE